MATIKPTYAASSGLTVTNLTGIPSSATWVNGWTSEVVSNLERLYDDYEISAQYTVSTGTVTAGEIRTYMYTPLSDAAWPEVFGTGTAGTQGVAAILDTEVRDSAFVLARVVTTDTTSNRIYPNKMFHASSCYGGKCPSKFALFVAQSTGAAFAASGQSITVKGKYYTAI